MEPVIAVSIFAVGVVLAVVVNRLLFPLLLRITHRTAIDLDAKLLGAARRPATLLVVVVGAYVALTARLDLNPAAEDVVDSAAISLGIVLGAMALVAFIPTILDWYVENLAHRTPYGIDTRLVPLVRRISIAVVFGLGGLLVMDQLDINISPLVAGLGLSGLAVALAIQPTLANIFAGTYVMTEGVISPGDYIELDGGVAGYVVDVSWRSTRIRTWRNNLVVVPNAKFAETIITNYQQPAPAVNVYLTCGVSYDSDLNHVERVSREVMDDMLEANADAVKEYGGWFAFDSFGDSNVNFWLFVQARDRLASFWVQSDLMQRLHKRFREEGIVINYPVRTLQLPKELEPEDLVRTGLLGQERTPLREQLPQDAAEGPSGGWRRRRLGSMNPDQASGPIHSCSSRSPEAVGTCCFSASSLIRATSSGSTSPEGP